MSLRRAPDLRLLAVILAALALGAAVPTAANAGPRYGQRVMKFGVRGTDVKVLQTYLTRLGLPTRRTGYFYKVTRANAKRLQKRRGWKVNGIVHRKQAQRIKRLAAQAPQNVASRARYYFFGKVAPTVALSGERPGTARVDVVDRNGSLVMRLNAEMTAGSGGGGGTGSAHTATVAWFGKDTNGRQAPDGSYGFTISDGAGTGARITGGQTGTFQLRRHIFPVRGSYNFGSSGSRFGAPRGGRSHQGQDVAAACGTPMVAAQGGKVLARGYQAGGAGHYIVIRGRGTQQDYVYMHMRTAGPLSKGQVVKTGGRIGQVGTTGSSTGCHLHFERWTKPGWWAGGKPYDPLPSLRYWGSYS